MGPPLHPGRVCALTHNYVLQYTSPISREIPDESKESRPGGPGFGLSRPKWRDPTAPWTIMNVIPTKVEGSLSPLSEL